MRSNTLSLSHHLGDGILASLAKIRMRLVLLTVEGKGLSLEIQKKTTSSAREPGEIAEGKKTHKDKKQRNKKRRRWRRRRHQEVERSENYSQGISLEHPPRRRAREEKWERGKWSSLSILRSFSLTHAPFASASLFVFTLGASRGGCVKARL